MSPTPAGTPDSRDRPSSPIRRWVTRAGGVYLIIAAALVGLAGWLALFFLADIAADPPYPKNEIPPLALRLVEHPLWMVVLSLPALLIGIVLMIKTPRRAIAAVLLGTAALLIPFVVAFYCFLSLIAPMYEYRDI